MTDQHDHLRHGMTIQPDQWSIPDKIAEIVIKLFLESNERNLVTNKSILAKTGENKL